MRSLLNRTVLPLLILIVAGAAPHCRADGLLYQLPEDGAKVVFDLKIETNGMEGTGTLTMSSVGKVTEDDKKTTRRVVGSNSRWTLRLVNELIQPLPKSSFQNPK